MAELDPTLKEPLLSLLQHLRALDKHGLQLKMEETDQGIIIDVETAPPGFQACPSLDEDAKALLKKLDGNMEDAAFVAKQQMCVKASLGYVEDILKDIADYSAEKYFTLRDLIFGPLPHSDITLNPNAWLQLDSKDVPAYYRDFVTECQKRAEKLVVLQAHWNDIEPTKAQKQAFIDAVQKKPLDEEAVREAVRVFSKQFGPYEALDCLTACDGETWVAGSDLQGLFSDAEIDEAYCAVIDS